MFKKENHNVPKDYDKTVKKSTANENEVVTIVGSYDGGPKGKKDNSSKVGGLKFNKKALIVLILLFGIGLGAFVYFNNSLTSNDITQENDVEIIIPEIVENKSSDQALLEEYNNFAPELQSKTQSSDTKIRAEAYKDLAYLALNVQRYDEALLNAKKYEELEASYLSADVIGEVAYEKGDYQLSVKYYDIAMSRVPKEDDPNKDTLYNRYLAKKQQAEQQL